MSKNHEEDFFPESRKERKATRKIASRTDRSKFKKTDLAKRERQLKEQAERKLTKKNLKRGRVLAILPEEIVVESEGETVPCVLGGVLKKEIGRVKNLITVGDYVLFESDKLLIASVEERYSVLSREDHLRRRQEQLIAANIDQVLITVSVGAPPLKPSLIDRYIIATRKGNMSPVILINKIDLFPEYPEEWALFEQLKEIYASLEVPLIPISIITGEGVEALRAVMKGKASVFSGQSGVGKSSLINAVAGLSLPIGDLIKKTKKGIHTTTTTQLLPLPFGGWCIDTPGIRSFGLWDLQRDDLLHYFPEIYAISAGCKYPDCTHLHEPNCAVRAAVEKGELSPLRFDSYSKLLSEII